MPVEDVKENAEKLGRMLTEMKGAAKANEGRLDNVEGKMAAFEEAHKKLTQSIDLVNRERFDRSVQGTSNRDLDRYTRVDEQDIKAPTTKGCYLAPKDARTAVRVIGHDRQGDPNDPRSKYRVWGLFDDPNPRTEWQRRAQQLLDRRNLVQAVLNCGQKADQPRTKAWQCEAELLDHMRSGPDEIAKIFADSTGIGAEWIPDNPMPELEREIMFKPSRWQMFPQVQMTRNPLLRPLRTGFLRAFKGFIPTADDPASDPLSNWTTASQVIEAIELVVGAQINLNAEEDAIVSFESEIRNDLVDAHVFGIENAITNGDVTATHMDAIASWDTRSRLGTSGLGLANDQRRAWNGQRMIARALTSMTTDASAAAVTYAHITADLNKVKAESLLSSDGRVAVVIEMSPETFFGTVINLAEFDAFDNVGLLASVLTGAIGDMSKTPGGLLPQQVGFIQGRFPVLINYTLTKDMAATGLFTGSGALTGTLTYDVSRFQMFILRGQMVKLAEDIRNNTRTLVSRQRLKWQPKDAVSTTNKTIHYRYNTV